MMRGIYDWMMRAAASDRAPHALAVVSFAESSFFPIPPDVMLIPMVIANRAKAWFYASLATISSVIGGVAGYAIGYYFFDLIGQPILQFYGKSEGFAEFTSWFNEWGVVILIAKGWTPIPFKVLTIAAGVAHMPLIPFILASIVTRAMRFFLVAGLLYYFGEPIRKFVEERLTLVTTVFVVVLVGGFVAVRYLI
ncbi:MAG: YqaA family protein [Hyphomicrobium sp.]|nr:YqaA family protein [Hyphomicrobium sp.]